MMQKPTRNIAKTAPKAVKVSDWLTGEGVKNKITAMMGGAKGEAFITSLTASVSLNPALEECDRKTLFSAALQGAALELSPSPTLGHFYIVPFNNNKTGITEANFQLGYKGYVQLAVRSGQYKRINVVELRQGELISWNPMTEEISVKLIEDEEARAKTPVAGYYAMFELMNGFQKAVYWSKEKMQNHAQTYSFAYKTSKSKDSFWHKDFDQMAFKTLLRQLIGKWGPMSIQMQSAFEKDGAVLDESGNVAAYAGNDENTINYEPEVPALVQKQEQLPENDPTEEFFADVPDYGREDETVDTIDPQTAEVKSYKFGEIVEMIVAAKSATERNKVKDLIDTIYNKTQKADLLEIWKKAGGK